MLTTLVVGIFYVVVSYAVTIGYGISKKNVEALATSATPFNTLADKFGDGTLSVFVNLAVISSFTALNIVTVIAVSRIFWKMGRDGLLPSAFSRINTRQSPHVACLFTGALALVASILFGAIYGALNFASWLSYFATLFFIAAYLLISVGLIRFMWRDYRSEFSWAKHAALPVIYDRRDGLGAVGQYPSLSARSPALVHLRHRRRPAHQRADRAVAGEDQARGDAAGWHAAGRYRDRARGGPGRSGEAGS